MGEEFLLPSLGGSCQARATWVDRHVVLEAGGETKGRKPFLVR